MSEKNNNSFESTVSSLFKGMDQFHLQQDSGRRCYYGRRYHHSSAGGCDPLA